MSMNTSIKQIFSGRKYLHFLLFLLPVLFFLLHLEEVPFPKDSDFTDLLISHYPNLLFFRNSIFENHVIPFWNPNILSGAPFLENPLSGFWYLPGWFALIWDSPTGIFFLEILHLVFAGLGMYKFLRSVGCSEGASLFGGIHFELMPKVITHLAAGHVTLVYAIAWTPWLLLAQRRSTEKKFSILPGLIWGLIIFADIRWAAYALIIWSLSVFFDRRFKNGQMFQELLQITKKWTAQVLFALGISAPFWIPFYKLVKLSTRNALSIGDSMELSLPIKYLMSFLFPDFGAYAEWITYFGGMAVVVVFFLAGIPEYRKKNRFWLLLFGMCFILSLGSLIPGLDFLYSLPGIRLLRVPTRFLFLAGFAISVLSAQLIDLFVQLKRTDQSKRLSKILFCLVILAIFEIMFTIGITFVTHTLPKEFIWGTIFFTANIILISFWLKSKYSEKLFLTSIIMVTILDLCGVGVSQFDFENWKERLSDYGEMLTFFASDSGVYRIYSPSYSIPLDIASYGQLELADGVDPLQLATYSDYMEKATGVDTGGYSVTLPPFVNSDPRSDNKDAIPNLKLLGRLNVKYLVSEFEIKNTQLELIEKINQTYIYRNPEFYPRVWLEDDSRKIIDEENFIDYSPQKNTINIQTKSPGTLVVSEINYPNWTVYLDGKRIANPKNKELLRELSVSEGLHTIEWMFIPGELYFGFGVAFLTSLTALLVIKRNYSQESEVR